MQITGGRPDVVIGLIDGPVATNHPGLADASIHAISSTSSNTCVSPHSAACLHGTFVAGVLCGKRASIAPAICPACSLLVRPVFYETPASLQMGQQPTATAQDLARAILDCIGGGARLLNISAWVRQASAEDERRLDEVLNHAMRRGVVVVAAAGNQGTLGSSAITRHRWVIPVAACDAQGRPLMQSNLGTSIGRNGLSAPGARIISLRASGGALQFSGTSAAAPFVTGTIALLWSLFPLASAANVKLAVIQGSARRTVVPPVLDAGRAYDLMMMSHARGELP